MFKKLGAALLAITLATPALADPVLGLYKTQPGDDGNYGHVELYQCGSEICGVIRAAFNGSGDAIESDNIGKRMIWGMTAEGNGAYSGGKIWAPDRDKTYNSKMELSGRNLEVSGCVLVICRAQSWTKVQ
ncbi:DUF2147 domain-containing protein [Alphaproteobacteria bacterium GH1-50]|uniref:DUF2147 domain-containing protein n=1 Tax=Kangsaoukella pontilimi TaxID=2691042 RepID=A0A7C9MDP1_9RHOB|nr:DUF2147 domain-containing protein [Kangsaoukella pontilimi]MXQ06616.1 DUF2147 domain-containing protein [Kangsaoukella pontilimi]